MTLTNKLKELRRKEEGFTIVELLIVIVVIAILAALVITSYLGIQSRARDSERQSDIRNIATAVQAYATINDGRYPECSAIEAGTVENIDPAAVQPPNAASPAWSASGASTEAGNYGCDSTGTAPNITGIRLTYTLENLPSGETNPKERILGEYTPTP